MELKANIISNRKRRRTRSIEEKTTKKIKRESKLISPIFFENRVNEIIKKAVEIFHDLEDQVKDKNEQIAYLKILKKVCCDSEWSRNRIISTRSQIKILLQKESIGKVDCNIIQESSNEWIKEKLEKFSGKTKAKKIESLSHFYKNYISSLGVKFDAIENKINEYSGTTSSRRRSNTSAFTSSSATTSSRYLSLDEDDIVHSGCRLCGSTNSRLIINIYTVINNNTTFKHLIENYCWYVVMKYNEIIIHLSFTLYIFLFSVKLDDREEFPQLICVECKTSIESFVRFCDKVDGHQNDLRKLKVTTNFKQESEDIQIVPSTSNITTFHNYSKSPPLIIQSVESLTKETVQLPSTSETLDTIFNEHLEERTINNMNDMRQNESSDEDLPPIVRENVETLLSRCKSCSIPINRLPIEFVPSDDENESDNENFPKNKQNNNLDLKKIVYENKDDNNVTTKVLEKE